MANNNPKVVELGDFWQSTAPFVKKAMEEEQKKYRFRARAANYVLQNEERPDYDLDKYDLKEDAKKIENEIFSILKKAGIDLNAFPFEVKKDKGGKETFVPKGKSEKEIKENIVKYKEEIKEALQNGKLSQEDYETLEISLEEIMEEKGIELEEDKEKDFELTNEEIEDSLLEFVIHNYGSKEAFEDVCKEYDAYDLDERKSSLQDFNSKINIQLGISGDLTFSTNNNLKFGNSFTKNGYMLTEYEVGRQNLKQTLYVMMEKSMIREYEIKNQQKISDQQKQQMHKKIMQERMRNYKKYKEKQDAKLAQKIRQREFGK